MADSGSSSLLPNGVPVPVVDIDESGTFKYVLIKLHRAVLNSSGNQDAMFIVRGHSWAQYHADLVDECEGQLFDHNLNLRVECVGGGRIKHEPDRKYLYIYGYSMGYGQANHSRTCELLKTHYHDYTIEWSNEGKLEAKNDLLVICKRVLNLIELWVDLIISGLADFMNVGSFDRE